jgi:hypothetical protein
VLPAPRRCGEGGPIGNRSPITTRRTCFSSADPAKFHTTGMSPHHADRQELPRRRTRPGKPPKRHRALLADADSLNAISVGLNHRIDNLGQHRHRPRLSVLRTAVGTGLEEITEWHICDGSRRYGGQASDQANQVGQAGAGDRADESGPWHAAAVKSAVSHARSHQHRTCSIPNQKCRYNTHRSAADGASSWPNGVR